MVAYLTKIFGLGRLDLAQDVVQDTLCRALEVWPVHGTPENPRDEPDGEHGFERVCGLGGQQSHHGFFGHRYLRQRLPHDSLVELRARYTGKPAFCT